MGLSPAAHYRGHPGVAVGGPDSRIDDDQRWALARRLLHDEAVATEDRLAGLLVVLYAQTLPVFASCVLTTSTAVSAACGWPSAPLRSTCRRLWPFCSSTAERAGTDRATTLWTFPGGLWDEPISAHMLCKGLTALRMSIGAVRTAAMCQLAVELPVAVLARCLGIDISSAVASQRAVSGDWHSYAAWIRAPQ